MLNLKIPDGIRESTGLLAYLALHLGLYFALAHSVPGFDHRGLRLGTDSIYLADIAEYEAQKNPRPENWLENFWPWNYWEPVQVANPAYSVAALPKILILLCGGAWRPCQVLLHAACIWFLWLLLSHCLIPGVHNLWSKAARIFFLLNPITVYLNLQISKEIPVLASLLALLFGLTVSSSSGQRLWVGGIAFSAGLFIFLWIRGFAQTAAFLGILVPILGIYLIHAVVKKSHWQKKIYFGFLTLAFCGFLSWGLRQKKEAQAFIITYRGTVLEQVPKEHLAHPDPDPSLWGREKALSASQPLLTLSQPILFNIDMNPNYAMSQVGSEGSFSSSKALEQRFQWRTTPGIPEFVDNQAARLSILRLGFRNTLGSTRFFREIPGHFGAFCLQIPQALLDGLLLPVVDFLSVPNTSQQRFGLLCLPWALLTAFLILLFVRLIIKQGFFALQFGPAFALSLWGLMLYGYVVLNLGALVRLRNPFWVLFISSLLTGLASYQDRRKRQACPGSSGQSSINPPPWGGSKTL